MKNEITGTDANYPMEDFVLRARNVACGKLATLSVNYSRNKISEQSIKTSDTTVLIQGTEEWMSKRGRHP